jgi:hypothetical protein
LTDPPTLIDIKYNGDEEPGKKEAGGRSFTVVISTSNYMDY